MRELASIPLPSVTFRHPHLRSPEIVWRTGADRTPIAVRTWHAHANKPTIVYLHGIEGHSRWFEHTGAVLNSFGFNVYAPDRRGAGLNKENRGHLPSYKLLMQDIEQLLSSIASENPQSPLFLLGNCWGAKPAVTLCSSSYKRYGQKPLPEISGLILTCPALFTRVDFNLSTKLGIGLDILRGGQHQLRQIDIPIDVDMFTDNRDFVDYIATDPLRLKAATSRFYFENLLISLRAAAAAPFVRLPLLLVQTDNDEIVNFEKVQNWYRRVPDGKKTLKVFQNGSHSIDFDLRWFSDYASLLVSWINNTAAEQ